MRTTAKYLGFARPFLDSFTCLTRCLTALWGRCNEALCSVPSGSMNLEVAQWVPVIGQPFLETWPLAHHFSWQIQAVQLTWRIHCSLAASASHTWDSGCSCGCLCWSVQLPPAALCPSAPPTSLSSLMGCERFPNPQLRTHPHLKSKSGHEQ